MTCCADVGQVVRSLEIFFRVRRQVKYLLRGTLAMAGYFKHKLQLEVLKPAMRDPINV